jgi:hypothetical protein
VILLSGGGNLGDFWVEHQRLREHVVQDFPRHKIIQLPQTMFFLDQGGDRHREGKHDRHQEGKHRSTALACGIDAAARGKGCSRWITTPESVSSAATG